jgi:peptidoglycan hydrolase CwlO-like protein
MASEIKRHKWLFAMPALVLVLFMLVLFAATAGATGLSDKKAEAAFMAAQIASLRARASAANTSWLLAQRKLQAVRQAVKASARELAKARARFQDAQEVVAARASALYKQPNVTVVDVLMKSRSFGAMVSQVRLFARLADYDRDALADLEQTRSEVDSRHQQLVAAREAATLLVLERRQEAAHTLYALNTNRQKLTGLQSEIKEMQASLRQPSPASSPSTVSSVAKAEVPAPTSAAPPSGGWWPLIRAAAAANGISAQGLYKLMMIESGGIQTIVGGGKFCGLFQYWPPAWKAAWNPYRAASIFNGAAQIKATALAISMGKGPYWWPGSYQHAFGGT